MHELDLGRSGLNVTVAYLESLDAALNCTSVQAGDYICTGGLDCSFPHGGTVCLAAPLSSKVPTLR